MIRNVGLLSSDNIHRICDAYSLYRQRDASADTDQAQAFRARYSRDILIKFLGIWDTVGALGIPLPALHWLNEAAYAFHDTELSKIVENAAHAVAVDEHRIDYQVSLWDPMAKAGQTVEQRWFIGAHTDVGGGSSSDLLSAITLRWMQEKAQACGRAIDPAKKPQLSPANGNGPIYDSYDVFLAGLYANTHRPYYRPVSVVNGGNETIDPTVQERLCNSPTYRPQNPGLDHLVLGTSALHACSVSSLWRTARATDSLLDLAPDSNSSSSRHAARGYRRRYQP
jgi:type VI secretion system (T6SS) phospholipase Tle1-like effector